MNEHTVTNSMTKNWVGGDVSFNTKAQHMGDATMTGSNVEHGKVRVDDYKVLGENLSLKGSHHCGSHVAGGHTVIGRGL